MKTDTLTIHRVVNGWMVRPPWSRHETADPSCTMVFISPEALAIFVQNWAKGGQESPVPAQSPTLSYTD